MAKFSVTVGNIGTVYTGADEKIARDTFAEYVSQSLNNYGRAGNETVILIDDETGEIVSEHEGNPFADSFMQPQIYKSDYYLIETDNGSEIVPADVIGNPSGSIAAGFIDSDSPEWDSVILPAIRDYVEGIPQSLEYHASGWLARLSAPGYMDCTDWTVHNSESEAMDYLIAQYGQE